MVDTPIDRFERIRDFYITYLETAFRIRHPSVQERRRGLLEGRLSEAATLCTDVLLEPIPRYESSGRGLADLLEGEHADRVLGALSPEGRRRFVELAHAGLWAPEWELRTHQEEMLARGTSVYSPGIVTSGTGSGKTEAFVLPLLATIADESTKWPGAASGTPERWWRKGGPFKPRRTEEERPKAVRALIIYPMNALVEDQMVRLRKSLDGDQAHSVLDRHFGGNRIFFGRYTGASPGTGHLQHPRTGDVNKSELARVAREMTLIEKTAEAALKEADRRAAEAKTAKDRQEALDLPFNFSRSGGSELITRWDMQVTPPDILISNVSMLSAMLMREEEDPIWGLTRQWLEEDVDSYFFLVLDELHLHRGTSGSEVSFLIRMLIHRLGLDRPANRHKLRILASSASMPTQGEGREASLDYMWQMFGRMGLPADAKREDWETAVEPGTVVPETPPGPLPMNGDELLDAVGELLNPGGGIASATDRPDAYRSLRDVLDLGPSASGDLSENLSHSAGRYLASALVRGGVPKATPTSSISRSLFGHDRDLRPLKALTRLVAEPLLRRSSTDVPSFRTHLFFRALEGLFVAPRPSESDDPQELVEAYFHDLTIERGLKLSSVSRSRYFETLYCECCGELFVGGPRATDSSPHAPTILPFDPEPDTLPESAKSSLFEELSYSDFAVFWPTVTRFWPRGSEEPREEEVEKRIQGHWVKAQLSPRSGATEPVGPTGAPRKGWLPGYVYLVGNPAARSGAGTAVPSQCPFCGVTYKWKNKQSPIRNFRAGFAKTTQLLASDLIRSIDPRGAKLVTFSDSRGDAASTALNLEKHHHEDLIRQGLFEELERAVADRPAVDALRARLSALKDEVEQAEEEGDFRAARALSNQRADIFQQLDAIESTSEGLVRLSDILDAVPRPGQLVAPVLARLVFEGVHPADPSGISAIPRGGHPEGFAWPQLFERDPLRWRDDSVARDRVEQAQRELNRGFLGLVSRRVFDQTYFAFEEAGLGFPCLSSHPDRPAFTSLLRSFTDSWRYEPRPADWDHPPVPWTAWGDMSATIRGGLEAIFGESARDTAESFLRELDAEEHRGGIIRLEHLFVSVVSEEDPFYRCSSCGRVHLHLGHGHCTRLRCGTPLPTRPTGTVRELRKANHLSKRAAGDGQLFRLRAEELTAQTRDQGARLRRFKGILIDDQDPILPTGDRRLGWSPEGERLYREVDTLSVTTTMEVGVDIGALDAIFQANMPPQRFNYQQRVGRAGRRGQAFSTALTICRSRSHDLHYFRHPEQITGDDPPAPFLASDLPHIARRFVLRYWLKVTFAEMRSRWPARYSEPWPGDGGINDVHGSFMDVAKFRDQHERLRPLLEEALKRTKSDRDGFVDWLASSGHLKAQELTEGSRIPLVADLISGIPDHLAGGAIGEALAELGKLPMYGMPTRVRPLYLGSPPKPAAKEWEPESVDRDLEIAVHEFAPGESVLLDKRYYKSVGLTGHLSPRVRRRRETERVRPLSDPYSEIFFLADCPVCGGTAYIEDKEQARPHCGCGAALLLEGYRMCLSPAGFRSDFTPVTEEEFDPAPRYRHAQAQAANPEFTESGSLNLRHAASREQRVFKINKGPRSDDMEHFLGFDFHVTDTPLGRGRGWILMDQLLEEESSQGLRSFEPRETIQGVFLAAPKVTTSLLAGPSTLSPGLDLSRPSAFRAAALSLSYLLVFKAGQELDVDPEEFEVFEPRLTGVPGLPVLQIADRLVNGSGLCDWLASKDPDRGSLRLERILQEILQAEEEPLSDWNTHRSSCRESCYQCLQRYGNRAYHGLLDWRLALDFAQLIVEGTAFDAGLSGFDDVAGSRDWPEYAEELAGQAEELFSVVERQQVGPIPLMKLREEDDLWCAIVHPFWAELDELSDHVPGLGTHLDAHFNTKPVTTFEMSRQPTTAIQKLRGSG